MDLILNLIFFFENVQKNMFSNNNRKHYIKNTNIYYLKHVVSKMIIVISYYFSDSVL